MAQNLTYAQCSDYYIPDIKLSHTEARTLGKYGRMRRTFLEQNNPILFNDMVLTEILFPYLWEDGGSVGEESCARQGNTAACMGIAHE